MKATDNAGKLDAPIELLPLRASRSVPSLREDAAVCRKRYGNAIPALLLCELQFQRPCCVRDFRLLSAHMQIPVESRLLSRDRFLPQVREVLVKQLLSKALFVKQSYTGKLHVQQQGPGDWPLFRLAHPHNHNYDKAFVCVRQARPYGFRKHGKDEVTHIHCGMRLRAKGYHSQTRIIRSGAGHRSGPSRCPPSVKKVTERPSFQARLRFNTSAAILAHRNAQFHVKRRRRRSAPRQLC